MPPAARITDYHTCPKPAHVGGDIISGASKVYIGYQKAARVTDKLKCKVGIDTISKGERTVIIEGQDAARIGDDTEHGGKIRTGCPTVLIASQSYCLKSAAASGAPFVSSADAATAQDQLGAPGGGAAGGLGQAMGMAQQAMGMAQQVMGMVQGGNPVGSILNQVGQAVGIPGIPGLPKK